MSDLISLFFGNPQTRIEIPSPLSIVGDIVPLGALSVDATQRLVTSRSSRVTKFPVEAGFTLSKGTQISDHMIHDNLQLQLTGLISEAPMDLLTSLATGLAGTIDFGARKGSFASTALQVGASIGAGAIMGLLTGRFPFDTDFPRRAMNGLLEMQKIAKPFTIKTFFEENLYTNMVITRLSFAQKAKDGFSLPFEMTAEQVQITSSVLIPVDPNKVKAASAASKQALGKKPTKAATAKQEERGITLMGRLTGNAGG